VKLDSGKFYLLDYVWKRTNPEMTILMNSKISLTHTLELQLEAKIELNWTCFTNYQFISNYFK
jgi:hypothetical protein